MKLQKIVNHLQKLHPREIDLSLDRIKILCEKLGNPQDKIKAISVVGTNGKQSTINAIFSILKEAKVKCNVYTSPHIQKINERFVFNNNMLHDDELINLFENVNQLKLNYKIGKRRDGDVVIAYADTSKIKNELNWTTKYSLENALKTAWNWELNINKNE